MTKTRGSLIGRALSLLYGRPVLGLALLLIAPLLWMGIIYLGSLLNLLFYSFYSLDDFTGQIKYDLTLSTLQQLFISSSNVDIVQRTFVMSIVVTFACATIVAVNHSFY